MKQQTCKKYVREWLGTIFTKQVMAIDSGHAVAAPVVRRVDMHSVLVVIYDQCICSDDCTVAALVSAPKPTTV
jgi:hypothetical protein